MIIPTSMFDVNLYDDFSSDRCIEELLKKWGLLSERVPLEEFSADVPNIAGSDLPGDHTIHMFVMTRDPSWSRHIQKS